MLANLIGGFAVIVVGTVLAPTIATEISGATQNASGSTVGYNITGPSATILNLTTLFYVLAVATTGIGIAVTGLKNAGVM